MYAFDVHCNAFLPAFLLMAVLQLVLCPVLLMNTFVASLLSAGAWQAVWGGRGRGGMRGARKVGPVFRHTHFRLAAGLDG